MADYGLKVIGDSGYYQIDGTTVNMVFTQSGTLSLPGTTTGTATLTINATSPIMVIYSPDGWAGVVNCVQNGNQFSYTFVGTPAVSGAFSFRWFVFDQQPPVSVSGFGLAVWNVAGTLVYSSAYKPMKIVGLIDMTFGSASGGGVTMPSGTYGCVPMQPAYSAAPTGGGSGARLLNSTVRTQPTLISYNPGQFIPPTVVPTGARTQFVVVDLTGYI